MANGVISIGGQKYAAGLYWQVSPETRNVSAAARAAARQPGYQAEFFCIRNATKARSIAQFGLGVADMGHKKNMPVAAACLANQQPGSWVGAFNVPEGIWFVVVRDDLIDPDGDLVFSDATEAQARLEQEIARGGISKIYAPNEWGLDASDPVMLTSLLSGRKDSVLQRTDANKRNLITLILLLLVIGLAYGGYSYYKIQEQKRAAEEQARQEEILRQQALAAGQTAGTEGLYKKEWQFSPKPEDWIMACEKSLESIDASTIGWKLGWADCVGSVMNVQWSREIKQPAVIPKNAILSDTLSEANASFPLPELQARGDEVLVSRDLTNRIVLVNNWAVTWSEVPDDVIPQTDPNSPPPPPPAWRKRKAVIDLKSSPWSQIDNFRNLHGFIITDLKRDINNWTLEGTFYETRTP